MLQNKGRLDKLKSTPAKNLKLGHIDSLELLELVNLESEIKVIVDIGANAGTWTLLAKSIFPNSYIYAFEPLRLCENEFNKNTQNLKHIKLYPYAVGNENIASKINLSSFADASSILSSTQVLSDEFQITEIEKLDIEIVKLDDFLKQENLLQPDLIKLDIQGYELEALKGATAILQHTKYIIMEVSFIEYYKNQPLFEEVILFMNSHNFKVKAFGQNIPKGKNLSQIDILFAKHKA
ncbi:FkbM family methyltransferase [Pedobacter polaris]|uniref:FkbM family methyltransferase n=1 Tax=Pedobacter polaris TaxID=2571273 RepID=UPI00198139ED|nr:FkbM family methyltransferase [Pedobacter polaris]